MRVFKLILFFTGLTFYTSFSYGVKVHKITIKGHRLIEQSLIKSHLQLKVKKHYSSLKAKRDVKSLSSLGFFDSIEVHTYKSNKGIHVIYKVKERPFVGEVEFTGNKKVSTEDLKDLSKVKEVGFLNFGDLYKTFSAIKDKYKEKGYFFAKVSHKISPLKKSQKIKLIIDIEEQKKTFIKKINFIGNRNISSRNLKSYMLTKEQSILSLLGSSGVYNPENLNRDIALIEYLYRDKGYLNVRLEKPEISISPDQKGIYISFAIVEGSRFKIGEVGFQEDGIVFEKDIRPNLALKTGDYFSLSALHKDLNLVKLLYKNKGYAFAETSPKIYPDQLGENVIHVLLNVNKGEVYKIDKVFIKGNNKTRDKVILRRLFLREGTLYQESQKNLTEQLLQQLGFFEEINLKPVKSTKKGFLDMHVNLKERKATGEAQLAGGYNGYSGLFVRGGIKKNNFLGLDQSLSFQVNFNRYEELFSFTYTNPYFFDSDWSFGFDVFNFGQDLFNNQQSTFFTNSNSQGNYSYSQSNVGFSLSLGRHLSSFLTIFGKYSLQKQSLSNQSVQIIRKLPVVGSVFNFLFGSPSDKEEEGKKSDSINGDFSNFTFNDIYPLEEGEGLNSSLSGIVEYKRTNDHYYPTKGYYGRASVEYSGLGGDFEYTKVEGKSRHYKPLFWKFVLKNSLQFGWVFSNSKDKNVPFTELFLLGGSRNLRGYQTNTVGPRRFSQQAYDYAQKKGLEEPKSFAERPYGGNQMIYYSLELEFPILQKAAVRGAVFIDIGEVNDGLKFDIEDQLRINAGVGVRWRSPFGPINIDLGFPYKPRKELGESDIEMQFGIGSSF